MKKERIGLIDIGSNTIRLVIYEIDQYYTIHQLQNIKTPARLSQYLSEDKTMNQDGIDTLVAILNNFRMVAEHYQVSELLPMATAAIRQSKNKEDILKQVVEQSGIHIQIVPEEKEAFYGSHAVILTTQTNDSVTVDIGGGSTEVTYFENKEIKNSHSFPFGVVTLKQLFFENKAHNDEKAIKKMQNFLKEQFHSIGWLSKLRVPVTAIGGSARSIANVHQRQVDYPLAGVHGYRMTREDLDTTLKLFQSMSIPELENLDGLSQDRADLIIQANVVFHTLYDEVKAPTFIVSNKGLREGIILDHINNKTNQQAFTTANISTRSIYRLGLSYHVQHDVADQRGRLVSMLYDECCRLQIFEKDDLKGRLLQYASYLYYIGEYVESGAGSQHTFYIISNSELMGITHKQRVLLALLASFKNRSLFKQYAEPFVNWYEEKLLDEIKLFGGLVKVATALNDSHMNVVKDIKISRVNDSFKLEIHHKGPIIAERYRVKRQRKHLARILGDDVTISFIDLDEAKA